MLAEALAAVAAIPLSVYLLEGVTAVSMEYALMAGGVLAAINLVLRAPLHALTKPLGCVTMGLFGIVVDAALVELCAYLMRDGFQVASFAWALAAALIATALRSVARLLFGRRKR